MSIQRQSGQQYLTCDECGDDSDQVFDKDDFNAMIAAAKAEGWSVRPVDDGWEHKCPSCAGSRGSALEKAKRLFGK